MYRLSPHLEPVVHVTLIAVALAISWTYWKMDDPQSSEPARTVHVDSSEVLSAWRSSGHRVLLFVDPTCPYCEQSMGFYARLSRVVDSLQHAGTPVSMAAVINRSVSRPLQRQMLRVSTVRVDTLLQIASSSLAPVGVSGVPTVALLDASGQTRSSWVGLRDDAGERDILSMVRVIEVSR